MYYMKEELSTDVKLFRISSKCYAANVKSHLWVMQAAREELAKNKGRQLPAVSDYHMLM